MVFNKQVVDRKVFRKRCDDCGTRFRKGVQFTLIDDLLRKVLNDCGIHQWVRSSWHYCIPCAIKKMEKEAEILRGEISGIAWMINDLQKMEIK